VDIDGKDTGLVITDPQNDILSTEGVTWGLVGASVTENNTIEHIEQLMSAAKDVGMGIFISPHYYYYYPTDGEWQFGGNMEVVMHDIQMFARKDPLSLEGFEGSGADWLERFKPYIGEGKTVVASPHKVYGPAANDLSLQLRKRGVNRVLLAGMSANLCVEAHLRQLLEDGFEVAVVKDATAEPRHPELGDGYQAALINYGYIASGVLTTAEVLAAIGGGVPAGVA